MDYEVTLYLREGFNSFEVKLSDGQLKYFNCILFILNLNQDCFPTTGT